MVARGWDGISVAPSGSCLSAAHRARPPDRHAISARRPAAMKSTGWAERRKWCFPWAECDVVSANKMTPKPGKFRKASARHAPCNAGTRICYIAADACAVLQKPHTSRTRVGVAFALKRQSNAAANRVACAPSLNTRCSKGNRTPAGGNVGRPGHPSRNLKCGSVGRHGAAGMQSPSTRSSIRKRAASSVLLHGQAAGLRRTGGRMAI